MSKLAVTVTVFFFVFAFSDVFSLANRLENDVIVADIASAEEPEPPGSGSGSGSGSLASDEVNVPVTFFRFHPINRHFPRRPLTAAVHFHRRPCHHRRNGVWGPHLELPYGRDMILSVGGEAETGSDRWPLDVVRQIPATHRSYDDDEDDHVKSVENGQVEMSFGQDIVIPSEESTGIFPEKMWEEKKHHREEDDDNGDEHEMGFRPFFPGGKILTTRTRIYPEENLRMKMIKHRYNSKEDNGKDEDKDHKEYKGLFMNKVRKFLTDLV